MSSAASTQVRLPVDRRVEGLLLWRDWKTSGLAFGGATLVFCFFQFAKVSFVSLFLYALAFAVFTMLLWSTIGGVVKRPPPSLPKVLSTGVDEAQMRAAVARITPLLNSTLFFAERSLNGTEPFRSLLTGISLYVAAKVVSCVPLLVLAYLPVLAAFSLPKVYEVKKHEVDCGIDTLRAKATDFYDKYLAVVINRIPRAMPASPAASSTTRKDD